MKKFYLAVMYIIATCTCSAQNTWAPVGATWKYTYYSSGWGIYISYLTMTSIGDTTIQGKECRVLNLTGPVSDPFINEFFYTYESNDTVWLYDGNNFKVLYNFNLQPGNHFISYGPQLFDICSANETSVKVDSIGLEMMNGYNLKYQIVSMDEWMWGFQNCNLFEPFYKIYEKIGCIKYMFPQFMCAVDIPGVCELRCYEDDEIGFIDFGIYDSCNYEYGVGVKNINSDNFIMIFPNPATEYLDIELGDIKNDCTLELFNSRAQSIKTYKLNQLQTRINISDLPKGIYILKFENNNQIHRSKMLKM